MAAVESNVVDVVPIGSTPRRIQNEDSASSDSEDTVSSVDSVVDADEAEPSKDKICMKWKDLSFTVQTETRFQRLRKAIRRRLCGGDAEDAAETEMDAASEMEEGRAAEHKDPAKRGYRTILYPSSGTVRSGKLTALMGSSGAGKSSFLNALSHQLHTTANSSLTGEVAINGEKLSKKAFKKYCGYVWQEDLLMPHLTVEETLTFYAHIRLPPSMSMADKKQRVEDTIHKLGLSHCRSSKIGNERVRGISGGEKRRVSIAVELIKNPQMLFLDEPTSGLDAKTSLTVMQTLQTLAHKHNHTILCTIHQPRAQIFELFDDLILMARGHIVFQGRAADCIPYFDRLGIPCPQHENPADHFIDVLTVDTTTPETEKESEGRVNYLIGLSLERREKAKKLEDDASEGSQASSRDRLMRVFRRNTHSTILDSRESKFSAGQSTSQAGFIRATILLLIRAFVGMMRDHVFLLSRIIQSLIMGGVISMLWFQMDTDQSAIQDRLSLLFLVLMSCAFPESLAALSVYCRERGVFQRERAGRMYGVFSYYIATSIVNLPMQIIVPGVLSAVVYWAAGLQSDIWRFLIFMLTIQLSTMFMSSLSLMLGAALPLDVASIISPVLNIFLFLLGGFYLNPENMPVYLKWSKFTSIFYYSNSVLIVNEFDGRDFYCKSDQYTRTMINGTTPMGEQVTLTSESCSITDGQQVIDQQSSDEVPIWLSLTIMAIAVSVLRIMVFLALKYTKPRR